MNKPIDGRKNDIDGVVSTKTDNVDINEVTPLFIQQIKSGSEEAFYRLVMAESGRLKDYVRQWLHCEEDAEEAAQEVFIYLWVNRDKLTFNSMPQLFKYINIAAKNQAMMMLREKSNSRKYREHRHLSSNEFANAPDEIIEMEQTAAVIDQALKQMPKIRAEAYDMKYNQGLSYEEISRKLKISESTARSHVSNAIRYIKNVLGAFSLLLTILD